MSIKGQKVGFIGGGNMGEALIKGLVAANVVPPKAILATDVRQDRLRELETQYGITIPRDNVTLVKDADVVVLAVKPQIMDAVLREIAPAGWASRRRSPCPPAPSSRPPRSPPRSPRSSPSRAP